MLLEDKYKLTKELILEGDRIEFDPVEKPKKERNPMYLASLVDGVLETTFSDLRDALIENDRLSEELNAARAEIDQANASVQTAQEAAQIKQGDLSKLGRAEALLRDLEETIEQFKQKRVEDGKQIQELSNKVNKQQVELNGLSEEKQRLESRDNEREQELQQITNDVNEVLDTLEQEFAHLTVEQ